MRPYLVNTQHTHTHTHTPQYKKTATTKITEKRKKIPTLKKGLAEWLKC
jgi:hypothetical protein